MPKDSCLSISHIQTWLLQLHSDQPTRHHTSSLHHALSSTVLHNSSDAWGQGITSAQLFGNSTGFPSNREFHSKSVSSCSTSIPGHLRVTCHPWPRRAQSRIKSLLVCQRRLRNPAHVQLIWSTSVRRCWFIRVEQSPGLPPSRAIYRIIQN